MNQEKKKYKYSTLENIVYMFSGATKWQPLIIVCTILFGITDGLKDYIWIYGSKAIIDLLESGISLRFSSIIYIVIIAACLEFFCLFSIEWSRCSASSRINDVRCRFILMSNKKVMKMPYAMLENPEILDARRKSKSSSGDMVNGLEGTLRQGALLLARIFTVVVSTVILLRLNIILVLFMLGFSLLRGYISNYLSKWEKENFFNKCVPKWRESYYFMRKSSSSEFAKDIRIYQMQDAIREKQDGIYKVILERVQAVFQMWTKCMLSQEGIGLIQEGIMYGYLIYTVLHNGMSIGDFTLYIGSIRSFNLAISTFLEIWTHLMNDSRMVCDYRYFLEVNEDLSTGKKRTFKEDYETFMLEKKNETYTPIPLSQLGQYEFLFENVSFQYPGSSSYAVKNLNIRLEAGKRLAVVGLNGAGKSTFIKLLCGLYEPTEGTILMNGVDISLFDKEEYYKLIAPVFQNVECFAFPLSQNISMLVSEETDQKKAKDCLEKAGLEKKVSTLKNGVQTEMLKFFDPEGIELSGGEKQKMALARALYKESPIVVLDEPTAALDALAEYKTYCDFDQLIGGKTAVYISHRLSSTRFCHAVAMFVDGELKEYGTHEELLKANGAYADMFEVQAQYYKEGEVEFNA